MIALRKTTNFLAAGTSPVDFRPMGPGATWDIQDSLGNSLWTSGRPVTSSWLKTNSLFALANFGINVQDNRELIILPFCNNMVETMRGCVSGFFQFESTSKYNLFYMPDAAATAEVFTLTPSGTPASGSFAISWGGYMTQPLAYNANAASIQSALAALPFFVKEGYAVTASGALSTTPTLTFSGNNGSVYDKYGLPAIVGYDLQTSAPAFITVTVTLTTHGAVGSPTSSNDHTFTIYAFMYKQVLLRGDNGFVEYRLL